MNSWGPENTGESTRDVQPWGFRSDRLRTHDHQHGVLLRFHEISHFQKKSAEKPARELTPKERKKHAWLALLSSVESSPEWKIPRALWNTNRGGSTKRLNVERRGQSITQCIDKKIYKPTHCSSEVESICCIVLWPTQVKLQSHGIISHASWRKQQTKQSSSALIYLSTSKNVPSGFIGCKLGANLKVSVPFARQTNVANPIWVTGDLVSDTGKAIWCLCVLSISIVKWLTEGASPEGVKEGRGSGHVSQLWATWAHIIRKNRDNVSLVILTSPSHGSFVSIAEMEWRLHCMDEKKWKNRLVSNRNHHNRCEWPNIVNNHSRWQRELTCLESRRD